MTPNELDQILRTLSEHEKGYRDGVCPTETRPFVNIGGVSILKSSFWDNVGTAGTESAPLIRFKQHSRFREYPLHTHDFVELAYMYDGMCVETLNDRILGLRKGQVLLVDSGTIHTIAPLREQDILINFQVEKGYFDSNFFNRLESDSLVTSFFVNAISRGVEHNNYILFRSEQSRRLPVFMSELMCECMEPSRSKNMLQGLFSLVVSELVDIYEQGVEEGSIPLQSPALPILRYIEENFRDCTLKDCADEFCVSTSYLAKLLKRECGLTFREVVQKERIEEAKRLLANDTLSVTDVARNVGYSNMSFFYKMFKRECGVLPGQYRKRG